MAIKTTFIYALCEPGTRTIRYIGKANDSKKRFRQHLKDSTKAKTHLGNWLRLLKSNGGIPHLEILDEVPDSQWEFWEREYIRVFRAIGMILVNSTDGGDGVTMTSEIREKIGAKNRGENSGNFRGVPWNLGKKGGVPWNLGKTTPAEVKEKQSAAKKGKRPWNFGKITPVETRARQSIAANTRWGKQKAV